MKNIGFKKLFIGYAVVVIITLANALYTSYITRSNKIQITYLNREVQPFLGKINRLKLLLLNSKTYITSWVYLQYNTEDKEALKELLNTSYPELKVLLLNDPLVKASEQRKDTLNRIFLLTDTLFGQDRKIMEKLVSFEDYENSPQVLFESESILEDSILPACQHILDVLNELIEREKRSNDLQQEDMLASLNRFFISVLILGFGLLIVVLFSGFYIQGNITLPVMRMRDMMLKISRGELPDQEIKRSDDVIAQMADALNRLSANFSSTARSAHRIGKGEFDVEIKPLSEQDVLGNALLEMKSSLQAYAEEMEEKVRVRTREIIKQKEVIETKNREITASINYALRIQSAMLAPLSEIRKSLPDSFVLFKPRDIVSGDFYWFSDLGNKVIISAVDCTGHGVPGAFMSMIGNNLLLKIVDEENITDPGEILNHLHTEVCTTLKQKETQNQDGMDVALCVLDREQNVLEFAGAKNPAIIINGQQLEVIKGDKQPIGGVAEGDKRLFTTHSIPLSDASCVYLFSDGFQDQFGGEQDKKFTVKRLKKLLLDHHTAPFAEQHEIYRSAIESWMMNTEQTDDILLIGFKV